MFYISKSKYCLALQCQKINWLDRNMPEVKTPSADMEERMREGNEVGDLAMGLLGDYVEVTVLDENGKIDIPAMIDATRVELERGTVNICEASFSYNGAYCAVDILHRENDGYAIYEVKSSSEVKDVYLSDISYQKYVLEHCGIKVTGLYIVHINKEYVFDGELKLNELFTIEDVAELADGKKAEVVPTLTEAERIMASVSEPKIDLSIGCHKPYDCQYFDYCSRHLPSPSVFDLYRLSFDKKLDFYHKGQYDFPSLVATGRIKNDKQLRQIDFELNNREAHIDKEKLQAFLDSIHYPIYFLDFETFKTVIPKYIGTKPNQPIPFQYSLHYIEKEGGELRHCEFLGEPEHDPRRAIAESLVKDISSGACILIYNKSFEPARLRELAEEFEDLSDRLCEMADSIVDLLEPFQKGYYYNRSMGGSFSIKSVLPAMFPSDPDLDYHNLEGVHNGAEAMAIYPAMTYMSPSDRAKARKNLLQYCKLDTLATVKVWEELVRACK